MRSGGGRKREEKWKGGGGGGQGKEQKEDAVGIIGSVANHDKTLPTRNLMFSSAPLFGPVHPAQLRLCALPLTPIELARPLYGKNSADFPLIITLALG